MVNSFFRVPDRPYHPLEGEGRGIVQIAVISDLAVQISAMSDIAAAVCDIYPALDERHADGNISGLRNSTRDSFKSAQNLEQARLNRRITSPIIILTRADAVGRSFHTFDPRHAAG